MNNFTRRLSSLLLSFLFIGCENATNDILDSKLEKEFKQPREKARDEELKRLRVLIMLTQSSLISGLLPFLMTLKK